MRRSGVGGAGRCARAAASPGVEVRRRIFEARAGAYHHVCDPLMDDLPVLPEQDAGEHVEDERRHHRRRHEQRLVDLQREEREGEAWERESGAGAAPSVRAARRCGPPSPPG